MRAVGVLVKAPIAVAFFLTLPAQYLHELGMKSYKNAKGKTMPTIKELWAVQLQHYPESIQLSNKEIANWIQSAPLNNRETSCLWRQMALCLCEPIGVFYRTSPAPDAWVGWRYGIDGSEYSSNWPRWNYANAA